ncbi:BolA domain-containing protein [Histoplasma capsulatum G186AR]|uniref:BolA domain-containing protein n=2 Tax=Ajellomyces capsulatus TaxID=5037 RepID=C0NH45_AJECG|nr:BolA domain-containing protein [Histoplasma capsulatum G186AR]EEH09130.1 BolA domain-containing protein [Histoplasma capsulatum G186AR]KAG5303546.1 BolA domain-containing protein [Histoplasma capsulatum]QSS69143.1 BolA domain-containing protein [Histoplasma capsulatum G186AR]
MFRRQSIFSRSCLHLLRHQRSFHFTASARSAVSAAMVDTANTSGITSASLKDTLIAKLDAQHVEIEDMSGGCGQAFQAIIVSPQFDKKNMLARHRLVNSVLKAEIAAIHAWTPKCYTPEQWENAQKGQS